MKKIFCLIILLFTVSSFFSLDVEVNCEDDCVFIKKEFFDICYNPETQVACWTRYRLTKDLIENKAKRPNGYFKDDKDLVEDKARNDDYTNSGYDRGHLVPADDMRYSEESVKSTFIITNVAPMKPEFNRGIWQKVENYASDFVEGNQEAIIITGTLFEEEYETIGDKTKIGVPKYFWKIMISNYTEEAFLIPQEGWVPELYNYKISLEELEEKTGLDFKISY